MSYVTPFVTQTDEPRPWIDCTWSAALMLALKATAGGVPATRAEREALRSASGDLVGGSTWRNTQAGFAARYGERAELVSARLTALTRLGAGWGASVGVTYGDLPIHLRRWSPFFTGGHRVYLEDYHTADGTVRWLDPLGRPLQGYFGERVHMADVAPAIWWAELLMEKEGAWTAATHVAVATPVNIRSGPSLAAVPVLVAKAGTRARVAATVAGGTYRVGRTSARTWYRVTAVSGRLHHPPLYSASLLWRPIPR